MWKLIWKDSLHYDKSNTTTIIYFPMLYISFMNLFLIGKHSEYEYIFGLYFLCSFVILTIFPLKLAKGLYLCPLTETERKKYLVTACTLRLGMMMLLLGLILMVSRFFLEANNFILLLQFVCTGIIVLAAILLSLPSSSAADIARQQYYLAQKLPLPSKPKVRQEEGKAAIYSSLLLITALILACIGAILPMNDKEFNVLLWLYYIPSIIVSIVCLMVYFIKYFDRIITINANREGYHYLRKKKVGAFHAD